MDGLKVKVRHVDGRTEEIAVEADQVLIGSGAHCEVRLPVDQARFEHVIVRATHAGLFAAARALDPPPTLNGAAFTEAPMLPGSVLRIKQSSIEITQVELFAGDNAVKRGAQTKSKLPTALATVAVFGTLAFMLLAPERRDPSSEPKVPPTLFSSPVASCPQKSAPQAKSLAESKLALARARRERGPFHVEDAVRAVPLYELAAACFAVAGLADDASDASKTASRLRADVLDDFRTRRMRFQYSLTVKDWKMAEDEVRVLRAYTSVEDADGVSPGAPKGSEYATWLAGWERKIQLTQGGQK